MLANFEGFKTIPLDIVNAEAVLCSVTLLFLEVKLTPVRPIPRARSIQEFSLLLFPNPCVNELSVIGNIESHFEIYSVKGELISEGNIKDNKINTSNLNPGSYLLVGHLKNGNRIVKRFVKTSF